MVLLFFGLLRFWEGWGRDSRAGRGRGFGPARLRIPSPEKQKKKDAYSPSTMRDRILNEETLYQWDPAGSRLRGPGIHYINSCMTCVTEKQDPAFFEGDDTAEAGGGSAASASSCGAYRRRTPQPRNTKKKTIIRKVSFWLKENSTSQSKIVAMIESLRRCNSCKCAHIFDCIFGWWCTISASHPTCTE